MKSNQLFLLEGQGISQKQIGSRLEKGYKLLPFQKPENLLAEMKNHMPDMVLCVHEPPLSQGLLLVEQLKSTKAIRHVPTLVVMNKANLSDRLLAMNNGADGLIELDEHPDFLSALVKGVLRNRAAWDDYSSRKILMPEHFYDLPSEDEHFMQKINNYIKMNLGNVDLNVHQLAFVGATSTSQLDRKLRRLVGLSPKQYIREYRLQVAKQLLRDKKGNVSEVASLTGFRSVSYFSCRFHERFGVRASMFRTGAQQPPENFA